jgi:hypothetical protein
MDFSTGFYHFLSIIFLISNLNGKYIMVSFPWFYVSDQDVLEVQ